MTLTHDELIERGLLALRCELGDEGAEAFLREALRRVQLAHGERQVRAALGGLQGGPRRSGGPLAGPMPSLKQVGISALASALGLADVLRAGSPEPVPDIPEREEPEYIDAEVIEVTVEPSGGRRR